MSVVVVTGMRARAGGEDQASVASRSTSSSHSLVHKALNACDVPACDHHTPNGGRLGSEGRNLQSLGQGQMPQCILSSVCCWWTCSECNKQ